MRGSEFLVLSGLGAKLTWDLMKEFVGGPGENPHTVKLWHQVRVLIQRVPAVGIKELQNNTGWSYKTSTHTHTPGEYCRRLAGSDGWVCLDQHSVAMLAGGFWAL